MEVKKRNPVVTLILAILSDGLGQMYNGQVKKGIIFMLFGWVLVSILGLLGLYKSLMGLISILLFVLIYKLIVIIEAMVVTIRKKEIQLKNYNNWFSYFMYLIMTIVFTSIVYSWFVGPQFIPVKGYEIVVGSMSPTLIPGDRVMFDKKYFANNKPQIGDIALFGYDDTPNEDYISRIVALEGDTVEYRDGSLFINGKKIEETFTAKEDNSYINFGSRKVPKGKVFMMGDNRMQSYDSRKRGSVSINNLRGKYLYKYLSN